MGFAYQNIAHCLWGIFFAGVGITIAVFILNILCELLKCICNCICCGACDDKPLENENRQEIHAELDDV